jgi:hypothetical protein
LAFPLCGRAATTHANDAYATSDFIASDGNERPVRVDYEDDMGNIVRFREIKRTLQKNDEGNDPELETIQAETTAERVLKTRDAKAMPARSPRQYNGIADGGHVLF